MGFAAIGASPRATRSFPKVFFGIMSFPDSIGRREFVGSQCVENRREFTKPRKGE